MHNIYLLPKFVSDHTAMSATSSAPAGSIPIRKRSAKSDTILCYIRHRKFLPLCKPGVHSIYRDLF